MSYGRADYGARSESPRTDRWQAPTIEPFSMGVHPAVHRDRRTPHPVLSRAGSDGSSAGQPRLEACRPNPCFTAPPNGCPRQTGDAFRPVETPAPLPKAPAMPCIPARACEGVGNRCLILTAHFRAARSYPWAGRWCHGSIPETDTNRFDPWFQALFCRRAKAFSARLIPLAAPERGRCPQDRAAPGRAGKADRH